MSDIADESEEEQVVEKFIPGPPFDDPSADFILRSSDDVDFRVHKLVLSLASPVFKDMLMLAQDPAAVPVLRLPEDHTILDWILRASYPVATPNLRDLDFMYSVVKTADKYQMDFVMDNLVVPLQRHIQSQPLRVFAIAYRLKDVPLLGAAARQMLRLSSEDIFQANIPEFQTLPVVALQSLLRYRKQCADIAAGLTNIVHSRWADDRNFCWWKPHLDIKARCDVCTTILKTVIVEGEPNVYQTHSPRQWFVDRINEVRQLLAKCPSGSAITWRRLPKYVSDCSVCGPAALNDLMAFSNILATQVDEAVAKIEFQLDPTP